MDIAKSELEVFLNNHNYEKNKLEQTREKLEELTKKLEDREKYFSNNFYKN